MTSISDMKLLREKIQRAMAHPYALPDIEKREKAEQLLAQKHLAGQVKKEEFEKGLEKIETETPSLIVTSIEELRAVLDFLDLPGDTKEQTLADLTMQYQRATDKGYACRFSIWFYTAIGGDIAAYCGTQIDIP